MSSKDGKPRVVPKFGSFKPRTQAEVEPEQERKPEFARREDDVEARDAKRRKSHHRDRVEGRAHHGSHHESRSDQSSDRYPDGHSERHLWRTPGALKPAQDAKSAKEELFTIDKRGDPLIIRYRGNDRSRVPLYRRIRRGILLGSTGYLEIYQDGPREYFAIRTSREGRSAFRDKSLLAQAGKTKSRLFKDFTRQPPLGEGEDFIALELPKKRKRGDDEDEDEDSASDHGREAYRSIEGKAKPHEDSDSAFESDSDDAGAEGYYITPAKRRAIELSRTVKEQPSDTEAWLELIGLQDVLFRENEEADHVRTRDETKSLADIKVSMFEKALPHARTTQDREKLLIGLMREGSRVWRTEKLVKRWAEVTGQDPESFAFWKSRMDFELSTIAPFAFDTIKQRFIDRLRFIEGELSGIVADEERQGQLTQQALYVFLRLTRFLDEAGFLNVAVGAWQALLELHFARVSIAEDSREAAIASLCEFWESEVPRIGEAGATGWRKFVDDGSVGDLPEPKTQVSRSLPQTKDVYGAWGATEVRQALEARMPAKTVDEGTDDDPYRVVMFADIEPFLVVFPSRLLNLVQKQLLDAYLLFCRLPPAFGVDNTILEIAIDDPFIYGGSRDFEQSVLKTPDLVDTSAERKRQPPNFTQDGSHIAISPDVLVPGPSWFNYLASWDELYPADDEPIERSYVLTTLRQLVRNFRFEELAEYHLALEWVNDAAAAKKAAKAVLKQYPSNVSLYNTYALIERANGNLGTSRKVLESAIGQGLASRAAGQMLRNTWAWIELESAQLTKALGRLCSLQHTGDAVPTPAFILKTKSELINQRDSLLSAGSPDQASHYAISLALLNYLSPADGGTSGNEPRSDHQGNIAASLSTCHAFSSELISRGLQRSPVHERFLQSAARLVYYHATHGPFRPVYIREQLRRFVGLFPRNTIFLSIFSWAESSLRIDDPVKALLRDTVLSEPNDSVAARVFAIRYELQVGNAHSVRLAFESAVESEACRGNSWLWLCYVRFCCGRRELRARAKEVFYRGIAACPGSKRLYMEAFGTLREVMQESELEAVLRTLEDKGLRVHVDFEGFAREWRGEGAK